MTATGTRLAALALAALGASAAAAENLYSHDGWAAMASDRHASDVGDILTVVIFENSVASNSAGNSSGKETRIEGEIGVGGTSLNESAQLGFGGRYRGNGQTERSGKMVAQISVAVEQVLPNGDLMIAGNQMLKVNGEKTRIQLRGRVRRADIWNNSVLSTRIADAAIDYDGSGFVTRSAKPGIVTRLFNWLGLL